MKSLVFQEGKFSQKYDLASASVTAFPAPKNPSTLTTWSKIPCLVWFCFFADHHPNSRHLIWYWQNAKHYCTFQLWVRTHFLNGAKSLDFVISGAKKKEKLVIQQLDVDIVPQACNYIKTETSEQVFLCEFCEFWQPVNLLKTRLLHRCFPLYFAKFLIIVTLQNLCEGLLLTIWLLLDSCGRVITY